MLAQKRFKRAQECSSSRALLDDATTDDEATSQSESRRKLDKGLMNLAGAKLRANLTCAEVSSSQVVWMRMPDRRWWPGMTLSTHCQPLRNGYIMVRWFSDDKVTKVLQSAVLDFKEHYNMCYTHNGVAKQRTAICKAIEACLPEHGANLHSNVDSILFAWAREGFQLSGSSFSALTFGEQVYEGGTTSAGEDISTVGEGESLTDSGWVSPPASPNCGIFSSSSRLLQVMEESSLLPAAGVVTGSSGDGEDDRALTGSHGNCGAAGDRSRAATATLRAVTSDSSSVGRMVWACLKSEQWWPAVFVAPETCAMKQAKPGFQWIYWFGDHKVSQVKLTNILPFCQSYAAKYDSTLWRKSYVLAIVEALQECAVRASRGDLVEYVPMLKWAQEGFQSSNATPLDDAHTLPESVVRRLKAISDMYNSGDESSDNEDGTDRRDKRLDPESNICKVKSSTLGIEDVCIVCDSTAVTDHHPLFMGGLCCTCKDEIKEGMFATDENGFYMYCSICGDGGSMVECSTEQCRRLYCELCLECLLTTSQYKTLRATEPWQCWLCTSTDTDHQAHAKARVKVTTSCLIQSRSDWRAAVVSFFLPSFTVTEAIPKFPRRELRVLSLFDGISTGAVVLDKLGLKMDVYYASEVDSDAMLVSRANHGASIVQLGDIRNLDMARLAQLAPIDLVLGGSPCNDFSVANPARRGLLSELGQLFYEFYRVLVTLRELNTAYDRHLFWLFENVASMPRDVKSTISRFFATEPALWDAQYFSAQHRARYFWGNLPAMYSMQNVPLASDSPVLKLSSVLVGSRKPRVDKVRTVTSNSHSLVQGRDQGLPVLASDGTADVLWINEVEKLFGLPEHYTDVGNLPPSRRHKLIGQSWSIHVIQHLLQPLRSLYTLGSN